MNDPADCTIIKDGIDASEGGKNGGRKKDSSEFCHAVRTYFCTFLEQNRTAKSNYPFTYITVAIKVVK